MEVCLPRVTFTGHVSTQEVGLTFKAEYTSLAAGLCSCERLTMERTKSFRFLKFPKEPLEKLASFPIFIFF